MTTQSPASRKSAERQRRKDAGDVRVEVWLAPEAMSDLRWMQSFGSCQDTPSEVITRALRFYRDPA